VLALDAFLVGEISGASDAGHPAGLRAKIAAHLHGFYVVAVRRDMHMERVSPTRRLLLIDIYLKHQILPLYMLLEGHLALLHK
jgi:hypothetical protein